MRGNRLTEGKWRRRGVHITGPHALVGDTVGATVGASLGARGGNPNVALLGTRAGKYAGIAAGAGISHAHTGKALDRLEKVAGSKNASKDEKVAAGREFRKSHNITSKFVLPKNEYERHKLAHRSPGGHIAHGALRLVVGSPWNAGRYATKVSYAKAGIHRDEELDMTRDELIEVLIYELMEEEDADERREQRKAKLKKWGKRAAIVGAAAGAVGLARTKRGQAAISWTGKKGAAAGKWAGQKGAAAGKWAGQKAKSGAAAAKSGAGRAYNATKGKIASALAARKAAKAAKS